MNLVKMALEGNDSVGWIWRFWVDDLELFKTEPLARSDMAVALFSIQRDPSRRNPSFRGISDDELFFILDGFFFGTLHNALRASAEEQAWARHLVSPSIPASVWSRMYLIGSDREHERLLVLQDGRRRTFVLLEGQFDKELRSVIERLKA